MDYFLCNTCNKHLTLRYKHASSKVYTVLICPTVVLNYFPFIHKKDTVRTHMHTYKHLNCKCDLDIWRLGRDYFARHLFYLPNPCANYFYIPSRHKRYTAWTGNLHMWPSLLSWFFRVTHPIDMPDIFKILHWIRKLQSGHNFLLAY